MGIHLTTFSSMPNCHVRNTNEFVRYFSDGIVRYQAVSLFAEENIRTVSFVGPKSSDEPTPVFAKRLFNEALGCHPLL